MKIDGKRILITGGSSGIGFALAADLATKGARLLISGRRPEALAAAMERLKPIGASVHSVTADVSTDAGRAKTLAAARDGLGGLDVLINNAGGVRAGRLEETTEAEIRAMVEVDLIAPILLTRAALPQLRQSGDGLVVNVASGIALIGLPFYTTYAATKAGLARFGEALRRELKGEGIHVLTAYPGATETPMMSSSQAGPDPSAPFRRRARSIRSRPPPRRKYEGSMNSASRLGPSNPRNPTATSSSSQRTQISSRPGNATSRTSGSSD